MDPLRPEIRSLISKLETVLPLLFSLAIAKNEKTLPRKLSISKHLKISWSEGALRDQNISLFQILN